MSTHIYTSIIDMIGNTTMFEARKLNAGPCRLFLKLEGQNPGGSIKDRIVLSMIGAAEQGDKIKPGGMVTAITKGGLEKCRRFLERTELFALAESLGGVESLIEHPAIMTHASIPPETRTELGISDCLVCLSCGIEDCEDLIADLKYALQ